MTREPAFSGEATATIEAPAARVFELITNIDRLPEWNEAIDEVVDSPASLETGAEWVVVLHVPHLPRWKSRSTVRHLDTEGLRFAYASTSDDNNPSYVDWFWEVVDRGGRSEVTVRWHGYPLTLFRRLVAPRVRRGPLEREVRASLDALTSFVRTSVA
jgi:uncharacterized protein YndB with AHSA1/START domain